MAEPPLAAALAGLGVRRGGVLLVHASLRGSGLRDTDLLAALRDALGPQGTLVVPAFTPENSATSPAHRAAIADLTEDQVVAFRAAMPPFDRARTGCPAMGRFAECVRTSPGAVRSDHPQTSFAALGPRAAELLTGHHPHCHLGERSPLARLYAADADVLLFRVGFEVCTAFHLAEYRRGRPVPLRDYRCVVGRPGNWITYQDVELDDSDFAAIGAALPGDAVRRGSVAGRPVSLLGLRRAVDHAERWMAEYRP
jgi:aminoglycoside 3-N-acetyltransferase